ncbi:GM19426 [Drosophila sechellia]|uniref:GM19426 n=1 Tax=Drosophila sechellia TaxID=7238 RepID=B4IBC1_DROSE|nr:GM19426 [Drosophila sechellia]
MQHKSRPGRLLVTRKEHQKIAVEKFSLSVRATTTTRTTSTGSRTWLKCAHVQKCHCFGFGRKQSGEAKAKNFLFPFAPKKQRKTWKVSPC